MAAQAEFRRGWRIVVGGAIGAAFSISALPFYTLGVFLKPVAAATGWSREAIQWGFAVQMLGVLGVTWIWGAAIDRWGARPVALLSMAGLALGLIALPLIATSITGWYIGWMIVALLGSGTGQVTWTRGISGWFDSARGMALGLALFGTGIAAVLAPPAMTAVIAARDWQTAYVLLGGSVVVIAMPLVALLFRDAPAPAHDAPPLAGATRGEALRDWRFWLILAVFSAVTFGVAGIIPNLVPLLTDRGLDPATAALYAGFTGLSVMGGRVFAGFLLDKVWAPLVAVGFLAFPALACFLLAGTTLPSGPVIGLAATLVGLAAGAEFDLIAFMSGRYFGMKNYGFIYGVQIGGVLAATGLAPPVFGHIHGVYGSYDPALLTAGAIFLVAPLLLLTLGRYPQGWQDEPTGNPAQAL
ncbi:MAG: MFS transporter [Polymorphobacter sp.]